MTHSGTGQVRTPPSAIRTALWFAILTVPAAVAAYYRTFSGFAEWDDEGSLMMTVRQYLTGAKLYEEIYFRLRSGLLLLQLVGSLRHEPCP